MVGRLELVRDPGGFRHFLAGRPVSLGAELELRVDGGLWVRGRYAWTFEAHVRPALHLELGEGIGAAIVTLPPGAILRWAAPRPASFVDLA